MSVKVTGVDKAISSMYMKVNHIETAVDRNIKNGAFAVESDAIKSVQTENMGTWVTRYTDKGTPYDHVAAKAGSAPNTDTSGLVSSIAAVKNISGDGSWLVGSNLDYAKYLEFGTTSDGGHMGARPWLIPALERNRSWVYKNIQRAVREQLR